MAGYRTPMAAPVLLRHRPPSSTTRAPHPERTARIVAVEAALAARGWLGFDARDSRRRPTPSSSTPCTRGHVGRIEALCARGRRLLDADTVVSGGLVRGGAARGGRRRRAGRRAARRRGATVGASLHRPPGHHAEPRGRWASACSTTSRSRRRHALDAHGAERVLVLDWDVHHGNGTNDIFHGDPRRPVHLDPRVAALPGHRPAGRRVGPRRGLHGQPAGPGGSGDATWLLARRARRRSRWRATPAGSSSSSRRASTRTRDDPLAGCVVTDADSRPWPAVPGAWPGAGGAARRGPGGRLRPGRAGASVVASLGVLGGRSRGARDPRGAGRRTARPGGARACAAALGRARLGLGRAGSPPAGSSSWPSRRPRAPGRSRGRCKAQVRAAEADDHDRGHDRDRHLPGGRRDQPGPGGGAAAQAPGLRRLERRAAARAGVRECRGARRPSGGGQGPRGRRGTRRTACSRPGAPIL